MTYLEERVVGPTLGADSIRVGRHRLARRPGARRRLHARLLQAVGHQRDRRDGRQPDHPARDDGLRRRDDDAARHRRLHPDDGHGRRLERADLRAHQGGAGGATRARARPWPPASTASFWTLFDTHVTSLIAAAFLFQFGTGPIRGFRDDAVRRPGHATCSRRFSCHGRCSSSSCRAGRRTRRPSASRSSCRFFKTTNYRLRPVALARHRAVAAS